MNKIDNVNNFDLIRLFAALQVVLSHTSSHLNIELPKIFYFLAYFPGVPIFFCVSGFLIANAYLRNPHLFIFFRNRILRLYPALWVCIIITIMLFILFKIIGLQTLVTPSFLTWVICQSSFFQFYTVDYLRTWGVGAPNGSLWTITVEIQFYLILPLLMLIIKKVKRKLSVGIIIILLIILSLLFGYYYDSMDKERLLAKLIHVSVAPYFFYFCFGILSMLFWEKLKKIVEERFALWLFIYSVYAFVFNYILNWYTVSYYPNFFGFVSHILLWFSILSFAFTKKTLSHKLLKGVDISYGVYIYHMLVVNSLLSFDLTSFSSSVKLIISFVATIILGAASWFLIEAPFLRKKSINKVQFRASK